MKVTNLSEIKIYPSILAADFANLGRQVREAESCGADGLHIDIMDGHFVEPITFGPIILEHLRQISDLHFDVHMMVENPSKYFGELVDCGANSLTVHYEACESILEILNLLDQFDIETSVAINPETEVDNLLPYLSKIDRVLVMSVNPGYGGQSFIESTLDKISCLRKYIGQNSLNVKIQVDGGINKDTVKNVVASGADIVVVGSAIFNKDFPVCDGIKAIRKQSVA